MIICSCNALTEAQVRATLSLDEAPRSPGRVQRCLGCKPSCGGCAPTIRKILQEADAACAICPDCPVAARDEPTETPFLIAAE